MVYFHILVVPEIICRLRLRKNGPVPDRNRRKDVTKSLKNTGLAADRLKTTRNPIRGKATPDRGAIPRTKIEEIGITDKNKRTFVLRRFLYVFHFISKGRTR